MGDLCRDQQGRRGILALRGIVAEASGSRAHPAAPQEGALPGGRACLLEGGGRDWGWPKGLRLDSYFSQSPRGWACLFLAGRLVLRGRGVVKPFQKIIIIKTLI